jgi:dipeptidase E
MRPGEADSKLLLISNSIQHGRGFLDHVEAEMREFLQPARRLLFVPFAFFDRDAYAARVRARMDEMSYTLESLHQVPDPERAVEDAEAVFVGGGNTFRLLKNLHQSGVMPALRRRVAEGMPYIGSSAGSIVACPTLKTTKDMPVVEPPSFEALGLVDFQISPHYLDPDPDSTHMGETQEERIRQFLEENEEVVVGLREGSYLRIEHGSILLKGSTGARIFRRGEQPVEAKPGAELRHLLSRSLPRRFE